MKSTPLFYSQRLPVSVYDREGRQEKAQKVLSVLSDYLHKPLPELTALDVGCASGIMSNYMASRFKYIAGIDVDRKALDYANSKKAINAELFPADATRLPFKSGAFDVVICAHVYEHVHHSGNLMKEIYRVLRSEGVCFFAAGNRLRLVEPHYRLPLLSVLPSSLADRYLRSLSKGIHYDENHLTYWGLKRLVSDFRIIDYTVRIIQNPEKFSATALCTPGSLKQRFALIFFKLAYWLVPTYVFLLQKTES